MSEQPSNQNPDRQAPKQGIDPKTGLPVSADAAGADNADCDKPLIVGKGSDQPPPGVPGNPDPANASGKDARQNSQNAPVPSNAIPLGPTTLTYVATGLPPGLSINPASGLLLGNVGSAPPVARDPNGGPLSVPSPYDGTTTTLTFGTFPPGAVYVHIATGLIIDFDNPFGDKVDEPENKDKTEPKDDSDPAGSEGDSGQ